MIFCLSDEAPMQTQTKRLELYGTFARLISQENNSKNSPQSIFFIESSQRNPLWQRLYSPKNPLPRPLVESPRHVKRWSCWKLFMCYFLCLFFYLWWRRQYPEAALFLALQPFSLHWLVCFEHRIFCSPINFALQSSFWHVACFCPMSAVTCNDLE